MKNTKSTIFGIVVAILVALFGLLQPELTGGAIDLKLLIPAAVIAIIGIVQKDLGSWHTTTVGIIASALMAGASTYQAGHHGWLVVIGSVLAAVGGSLAKDSIPKTGSSETSTSSSTSSSSVNDNNVSGK